MALAIAESGRVPLIYCQIPGRLVLWFLSVAAAEMPNTAGITLFSFEVRLAAHQETLRPFHKVFCIEELALRPALEH